MVECQRGASESFRSENRPEKVSDNILWPIYGPVSLQGTDACYILYAGWDSQVYRVEIGYVWLCVPMEMERKGWAIIRNANLT